AANVLTAELLGVIGALRAGPAVFASGLWLLAAWLLRRPSPTRAEPLSEWQAWAYALACGLSVPFAVRGLLHVPLDWDSLNYHLLLPAQWIRLERIFLFEGPFPFSYVSFFPMNCEMVLTLNMSVLHNDLLAETFNLPLAAVCAVGTGALARRLGATPGGAVFS